MNRLREGWAGESFLQGDHLRDVSYDHGKEAQCIELTLTLRWLPVGRGEPGSAVPIGTGSRVTGVGNCCLTWDFGFLLQRYSGIVHSRLGEPDHGGKEG